jgi:hypothetical protein
MGINISREKVLALEYAMLQLQHRRTFLPCYRHSTIGALHIPSFHFCVPLKPNVHSTFKISKIKHHNLTSRIIYHIKKMGE